MLKHISKITRIVSVIPTLVCIKIKNRMKIEFTKEYMLELWNGLVNSFKYTIENTFDYKTRSSRKEIISFTIGVILIFVTVNILTSFSHTVNSILSGLLSLIILFPSVSICVRRLHDTDKQGLYILIPILGLIQLIIVDYLNLDRMIMKVSESTYIILLLIFVGLLSRKGNVLKNKYGEVPTL